MRLSRFATALLASSLGLLLWFAPDARAADTVFLKDGTTLTGKVVKQVPGKLVVIETAAGTESIPWEEVKRVSLGGDAPAGTTQSPTTTAPPSATDTAPPPPPSAPPPAATTAAPAETAAPPAETSAEPAKSGGAAAAAFEIGARAGYGLPLGDIDEGDSWADNSGGKVPLILDIGVRIKRAFFIGGYLQYGFLGIKGGKALCPVGATDCSGSVVRAGIEAIYHVSPDATLDPWIGLGVGYEWATANLNLTSGGVAVKESITAKGAELFNLQFGFDYMASPSFGIGPFVQITYAKYDSYSTHAEAGGRTVDQSGDIVKTSAHEWLIFGVRGTFQVM